MGLVDRLVSRALGREAAPGDVVIVDPDVIYAHDGTSSIVIDVIEKELKVEKLEAANKSYMFIDHAAPAPHVAAATVHREMRRFARRYGVKLFEAGTGISHQVVVERGIVRPGMIVIATDSHTPTIGAIGAYGLGVGSTDAAVAMVYGRTWIRVPETFKIILEGTPPLGVYSKDIVLYIIGSVGTDGMLGKAVEYRGSTLRYLSVDARMTLTNMSTEMGAESSIIPVDEVTRTWLEERNIPTHREAPCEGNDCGEYADEMIVEVEKLEPMVSAPPDVDNVRSVAEVEGVEVDQVFIGSCANGRLEDIAVAARILSGRKVKEGTRCIVAPASRRVYMDAIRAGYIDILLEAGCIVAPPTCGPCVGAHMGLLAEGEVAVSTSNRNFPGRMGHRNSRVYLASPATAAASAVEGRITDPRKYLR